MIEILNEREWSTWLQNRQDIHLLQTAEWGNLKEHFGWNCVRTVDRAKDTGAQILFKQFPLHYQIAYIPKGPIGNPDSIFWKEIDAICKQKRTVFLKIEPDHWDDDQLDDYLESENFLPSTSIQPRRTIDIALTGDPKDWLDRMKAKTRYNIRLAEKKNIVIKESERVDIFYDIMVSTGNRDKFGIHSREYYQYVHQLFFSKQKAVLLLAYYQDQPLAGLMVFRQGRRAWYFYGASNEIERNRMPTYLLQFKAMQWAANHGCTDYDLWGIPDFDEEYLEANFQKNTSDLWGVYRFKRGFGGTIRRYQRAYDRVYNSFIYTLYKRFFARRNSA